MKSASANVGPISAGEGDARVFRLLVEAVEDYAIFLLTPGGHVASWNLGAQKIKGYRADEIIGQHFSVFYPAEATERGWPAHELKGAVETGRFEDHGWRVRKDGSLFWANVVITALWDESGNLRGFAKITRDLSERRRYEESLRQSEERFRLLLGGIKDYAIFMLDPQGVVATWNPGAKAIGGYDAHEIIGRSFEVFYPHSEQVAGRPAQHLIRARDADRVVEEGWRVRHDGSLFWASVVLTGIRDANDTLYGYAQVIGDMSKRKQLEDLERSSRRMNEFLAMLAHELRNPLAPIRTAVEVMQRDPPENPIHVHCRDMIDRQVTQLKRLVDDLLDVSRITAGKVRIHPKTIEVAEVIHRSLEVSESQIRAREQVLDLQLPRQPLWIYADMLRLSQAVQNLLNNASKFTPRGGRIGVRCWTEDALLAIEVSDSGTGIDPHELESIFDLFEQGSQAAPPGESGLGVGLSLVRSIVEMHGGAVEALSPGLGQGSRFQVRLPLVAPPRIEEAQAKGRESPFLEPTRFLVVDDNRDAADSLALLLESMGHAAAVAYDGPSALARTEVEPADVVLLDISMPGMTGFEVARAFSRRAAPPRLIALTGFGAESAREFSDAGFSARLIKPVEEMELLRVIADATSRLR